MTKRIFLNLLVSLVFCFFIAATNSLAADITLEWDPPEDATQVVGYKIHYGTASGNYSYSIDVGNVTSYTVTSLNDGQTYYFTVLSYDSNGEESLLSNETNMLAGAAVVSEEGGAAVAGGESGGGGCFIATAAFGSYLEPHVRVLRDFRDKSLLTNVVGRAFVKFYYRHSPPIADFIRQHGSLRLATRLALSPLIFGVEYPYAALALLLVVAGIALGYRRRRTQPSCQ